MINTIGNGGLKVTHIISFINSLKCTWIRRYTNDINGTWKMFFDIYLKPFGKQFIFHCNCAKNDVNSIRNSFIRQIVYAWCDISFSTPTENFGNQVIWNNSHIRIDNKIVMNHILMDRNVIYVSDLFDEHNKPLTFVRFKQVFNADIPFTLYWGLISAIPQWWKRSGCHSTDVMNNNNIMHFNAIRASSISQHIYKMYLHRLSKVPTAREKWSCSFKDLTKKDWDRFFKIPYYTVLDAKLQYFQFKFLHRIIATNKLLALMGINDTEVCSFCNRETENIEHLFWDCNFTGSFILDVENRFLKQQFFFSKQNIFFGYGNGYSHPYNFLIIHMKYYIYDCKRNKNLPNICDFFYKFKFAIDVERYIHSKSSKCKKDKVSYIQLQHAFSECPELFRS